MEEDEHPELAEIHAELARRYAKELSQADTDTELAEIRAELVRRAKRYEEIEADPMTAVPGAIRAMAVAFGELAASVAAMQRPVVKTIERDGEGNIARIVETQE